MARRRRRKWKAPNNPTAQAKQVWRAVYPEDPWPVGLRVRWVGFYPSALGFYMHGTRWQVPEIVLSYGDARKHGPVGTLVHEFVHARGVDRHTADFYRLVNAALDRLGLPAETRPKRREKTTAKVAA